MIKTSETQLFGSCAGSDLQAISLYIHMFFVLFLFSLKSGTPADIYVIEQDIWQILTSRIRNGKAVKKLPSKTLFTNETYFAILPNL